MKEDRNICGFCKSYDLGESHEEVYAYCSQDGKCIDTHAKACDRYEYDRAKDLEKEAKQEYADSFQVLPD